MLIGEDLALQAGIKMSDIFEILHKDLVYLDSEKAFEEFMTVYKFRGGKYIFKSLFEIQNFYYPDENGEEDDTRSLLANRDGYGCLVNNTEYQKLLDLKNILVDKRISKEEFLKRVNL